MKQFTIITAILLLITAFFDLHTGYWYYQLLRWMVTICSLLIAFNCKDKDTLFFVIFCVIAVLFNPIAPIYLKKGVWKIIDFIVSLPLFTFYTLRYENNN